jgi:MFS family permease
LTLSNQVPLATSEAPVSAESIRDSAWPRGLRSLAHYNYRLYFVGQTISMAGTWMQNVAQGWLVLNLTHSAFQLGLVVTLQTIPILLFSLAGGVLADRMSKRHLLLITQTVMALLALALAIDVSTGRVQIWHVYILATLLGTANAMTMPTQQSFIVEMVGKDDLLNAISLNSAIVNLARIIGPAVAGVLIAVVGIALCFYLNALSFLAVIASLWVMRPQELRRIVGERVRPSVRRELAEGLNYVRRTWTPLMIMILAFFFGAFVWTANVVFPVFARLVLNVGSEGYGVMTSAFGIGSLIAVSMVALTSRPRRWLMFSGMAAAILFSLAFAWSRNYPITLVFIALLGGATFCFSTQTNTLLQSVVPDALRGRVMSVYMMLFVGSQPLGALVTGTLASAFGAPVAVTVDVCICALVLCLVLIYDRRVKSDDVERQRLLSGSIS